jgi:hypothetical protein
VSNLYKSKSWLISWLSTDYRLSYRPDNLSVLELTESRLPHVHVVLFGVSWAVLQSSLAAKWHELGESSVVDIRSAWLQEDDWLLHHDDRETATLHDYLDKAVSGLQTLAGLPASDGGTQRTTATCRSGSRRYTGRLRDNTTCAVRL